MNALTPDNLQREAADPRDSAGTASGERTTMGVLVALSLSHGLNDTIQALIPSIYPLLKESFALSFVQVGMITFVFQLTGSLLQPWIGHYTDRRPLPYSLALGMAITLTGLVLLARATSYPLILVAAGLVGTGSAIFHPEASRLARLASGGRHGFAQSFFQVGGNFGSALGPLLAAAIVTPFGRAHILWFSLLALLGIAVLGRVGSWYQQHLIELRAGRRSVRVISTPPCSRQRTILALAVLGVLLFSKFIYLSTLTNYYTFYLIEQFAVTAQQAQYLLFLVLLAFAAGTMLGGPMADRLGHRVVIWFSILGVAPFSIGLPYAGLVGCAVLSALVGVILSSAFSVILVYAQELLPGKVGMVAGLFFGFAFGIAGISSALLGWLADHTSVHFVFVVSGYLPLLGLLTVFLPRLDGRGAATSINPAPRTPGS